MKIQEKSINLRRHIRNLIKESDGSLDFKNVEFISRAVADEIYYQTEENNIEIKNIDGDAKKMLDTVTKNQ